MIVFVWTLQDRIAEVGAVLSLVLWVILTPRENAGLPTA
jgi:hypothetical protein